MQKCEKCNSRFNYRMILSSIWNSYNPITCNKCATKHEMNYLSKIVCVLLILLPLPTKYIFFTNPSNLVYFISSLLWGVVVVLLSPYYFKYHIESA